MNNDEMKAACAKLVGVLGEIHHATVKRIDSMPGNDGERVRMFHEAGAQLHARVDWKQDEDLIETGIFLTLDNDSVRLFELTLPNPRAGMSASIN